MARRGYPAEFRRRVIELVEGGRKISQVSKELGVSQQTIYVWRRQARIDAGVEAGVTSAENVAPALSPLLPKNLGTPARASLVDDTLSGSILPVAASLVRLTLAFGNHLFHSRAIGFVR